MEIATRNGIVPGSVGHILLSSHCAPHSGSTCIVLLLVCLPYYCCCLKAMGSAFLRLPYVYNEHPHPFSAERNSNAYKILQRTSNKKNENQPRLGLLFGRGCFLLQ